MDLEPAQGGGVSGKGSGGELGRGDGDRRIGVGHDLIGSLDSGVGHAGDARTGTQESRLRIAALGGGVFVVVQKLAFGVDERPGLDELSQGDAQERGGMLLELGFGESRLFERRDFGTFKERLRSLAVEEIGQAGEGLPRVGGGWFGPSGSGRFSASGGVHTPQKIAAYIKRARRKYSCLYLFFKEGIRTGRKLTVY